MQPPLPEVPKVSAPSTAKPAFLGLNIVAAVESLSILISCFLVIFAKSSTGIPVWVTQITTGVMILIYAVVVYYLWRGYNWARWTMFALCVISILSLFSNTTTSQFPEFERIYNIAGGIWAFGVGIWLLLPNVARHFKSPSGNTPSEINAG